MATATPTNTLMGAMLAGTLTGYSLVHAYKYDRFRCFIPSRKNATRTVMVGLHFMTCILFTLWLLALSVIKYNLGYVYIPNYGYIEWPLSLWPAKWESWTKALAVCLVLAFSFYDAINIEEYMFWINMIRSVRRSNRTNFTRWLSKKIMLVWFILALAGSAIHISVALVGNQEANEQNKRIFITEGFFGILVLLFSIILSFMFPRFINEVKANGGSADILGKLTFFHSMNKLRIVFRFLFSAGCLILGFDSLTKRMVVNENRLAADLLFQGMVLGFALSMLISFMLYLPISWSGSNLEDTSTFARRRAGNRHQSYFAMQHPPQTAIPQYTTPVSAKDNTRGGLLGQFKAQAQNDTILELMRSRGTLKENEQEQIDRPVREGDEEYDVGSKDSLSAGGSTPRNVETPSNHILDRPFEDLGSAVEQHQYPDRAYDDGNAPGFRTPVAALPTALANFRSPFEGLSSDHRSLPQRVVIQVARQVETHVDDAGDEIARVNSSHSGGSRTHGTQSFDVFQHYT